VPTLEEALRQAGGWRDALITGEIDRQREVLAALVERVTPERTGRGKYAAGIMWTRIGEDLRTLVDMAKGTGRAA
jgi:hypothetical protein